MNRSARVALCLFAMLGSRAAASGLCADEATNVELKVCLVRELEKAEVDLTFAYRKALDVLPGQKIADVIASKPMRDRLVAEKLVESQRAWLAYRRAQCSGFVGQSWEGGSGQSAAINACSLDLTEKRVRELRKGAE